MRSTWHILIRLLIFLAAAAYYVAFHTYFWLTSLWLILLIVLLAGDILRIHRRAERDLRNFLLAVSQHDFSTVLPARVAKDYPAMSGAYTTINKVFQEISLSQESSQSFLEVIVEQVGVALIGYRTETGEITLINKVAKDLTGRPYLHNISGLKQSAPELLSLLETMSAGDRSLISIPRDNEELKLSVVARELVLEGFKYKLFAIQNIRSELEEQEIESWMRLLRVLTHEIKNSAIPIATLSDVIAESLTDSQGLRKDLHHLEEADLDELSTGLKTIRRRSKGLVDFIETYSRFTKLPKPDKARINVLELTHSVTNLLQEDLNRSEVELQVNVSPDHFIKADAIQLEQVLINLIKNAIEAIGPKGGTILIESFEAEGRMHLKVIDNGPGMDAGLQENIFVPFYTTREKGSGIGLSISKQIIRAHRGEIKVTSSPGNGTEFEIILSASR